MIGPSPLSPLPMQRPAPASPRGFTLIELLISTTLSLILMAAVTVLFGQIARSINDARGAIEIRERLRNTQNRLQADLAGLTVLPVPPRHPQDNEGYLEIIEGPRGVQRPDGTLAFPGAEPAPINSLEGDRNDTTVGDTDDILLFTTRSPDRPFLGRALNASGNPTHVHSDVAEVAWFIRGRTLYRRQLLVAPSALAAGPTSIAAAGFYADYDISVRHNPDTSAARQVLANTLADLTLRENRFAHPVNAFPYDARRWGQLGLPLLQECSASNWIAGYMLPVMASPSGPNQVQVPNGVSEIDLWQTPHPWTTLVDADTGCLLAHQGPRIAEDVILSNVIGFDVKVWEPGPTIGVAGPRFVDLGYQSGAAQNDLSLYPPKLFYELGDTNSSLRATDATTPAIQRPRTYDTWSSSYGMTGMNGFDDDSDGLVDEPDELGTNVAPYPVPLRGIQVRIRCYDPDSGAIHEVTVQQDFLPK